jgi:hypothetical protein
MALPIQVICYSGYKPNERPCTFLFDEELYDVQEVLQRWREPFYEFFKVVTTNSHLFVLRYALETEEWTLQADFDGAAVMSRPGIELILVDAEAIRKAETLMECCEQCHPDDADTHFDWLLAEVTGKHGMFDFIMAEPARCPICKQPVKEGTLVEPKAK